MNKIIEKIINNQILFFLIIINGLGIFAGSLLSPIESVYLTTLTDYKTLVGLTFSLGTIFIFALSLLIGRFNHYIRRRKLVIFGLALGIVYPLIYASALNIFQYMFGRSLWAFSSVSSGVLLSVFFQDFLLRKKNIAEISGIKSSFYAIAGTFGAISGGYLADEYGMATPFYAVMAVYVLALIFFVAYIYPKIEKLPAIENRKKGNFSVAFKNIKNNPHLFLRVYLEGITQSHWAMEPIIFPILIYNLSGKSLLTGLIFGLMGVIAMIILPVAGRFIDRKSSCSALKITFVLYVIAFSILSFSNNILIFTIGAVILSLGKSFNGPAFDKIETKRIASENRIEYLSYFKAYDTLTAAATCLIVGFLLDFYSPKTVLMLFTLYTAVGGFLGFKIFDSKLKSINLNSKENE